MRIRQYLVGLIFVSAAFHAYAQSPAAQSGAADPAKQDPTKQDPNSQLTPQQVREKQIRVFDPLDKSNPLIQDGGAQGGNQDPNNSGASAPLPPIRLAEAPLPGSVAESNQAGQRNGDRSGPEVQSDDQSPTQDYTGPAVLSRSYTISRPMTPHQIRWAPRLGFTSSYDDSPTATGGGYSGAGYSFSWGVTGRHLWRHDQIGLDYSGSESRVGGVSGPSSSHLLNADYQHQFSRRLAVNVVTSGSIYSQHYGLLDFGLAPGASLANINIAASPSIQVLDTGTRQLSNQVSLTYSKSSRLSFSAAGGQFFAERTGGLYGNTGYQAQTDVNYRKTRKMTVGAYYSFTDYMFSHRVSMANQHTVGGIFSYALNRTTQFRFRGGVTRLETQGLATVAIDPEIAALLGQTSTIIEFYRRNMTSDISAEFAKDFRHNRTANVSYIKGVTPGNGLLLTSTQEGITGSFQMRVLRKYSVSFTGGRVSLSSAGQNIGQYTSNSFSLGVSRPVTHHVNADFGVSYRSFDVSDSPLLQHQLRITSGLSWGPGENWLRSR